MESAPKDVWLFAAIKGIVWAILLVLARTLLLLAFGHTGQSRFYEILVIGAVLVAIFCAQSYRSGWKHGQSTPRH